MSLREFYKSQYATEAARKTELTAALSLPVGVLSVLVGGLVVMSKELHLPFSIGEHVQFAAIALSAFACACAGYFLFRSLYNFAYGYSPTALELKNYKEKLVAFHRSDGQPESEANQIAEAETLKYIDGEYAKNTDRNSKNNDIKSSYLHRANGSIIAAVAFAAVACIAYVFNSVSSPKPIQRIELVNPKEVTTMPVDPPVQPTTPTSPPPVTTPVTRPAPPPSRVIKEDKGPQKPPAPLQK